MTINLSNTKIFFPTRGMLLFLMLSIFSHSGFRYTYTHACIFIYTHIHTSMVPHIPYIYNGTQYLCTRITYLILCNLSTYVILVHNGGSLNNQHLALFWRGWSLHVK